MPQEEKFGMYSVGYVYNKATMDLTKLSREWGNIYKTGHFGLKISVWTLEEALVGSPMQEEDFQKLASHDKSTDYGAFNSLKKHIEKKLMYIHERRPRCAIALIHVWIKTLYFLQN